MAGQVGMKRAGTSRGLRQLSICGGVILLGCLAFFVLLQSPAMWYSDSLIQHRFPEIFVPIQSLFPAQWLNHENKNKLAFVDVALFTLIIVAWFGALLYAMHAARKAGAFVAGDGKGALKRILLSTAAGMFILLLVRGILTSDIFLYLLYSRIWVEQGVSPYLHVPIEYAASDAANWLQWSYWKDTPDAYGPLWTIISGGVFKIGQLGDGDIVNQLLGLRILVDVSHLLNIWLLWNAAGLFLQRYGQRLKLAMLPRRNLRAMQRGNPSGKQIGAQVAIVLFYAWNPITLVEFGISGHNDAPMMTFVLAALWLHLAGKWRWAVLALAAAALIKLSALVFLPAYVWMLFWQDFRTFNPQGIVRRFWIGAWRAVQAGAIIVLAFAVCYAPFWEGPRTLTTITANAAGNYFLHSASAVTVKQLPALIAAIAFIVGWQQGGDWTAKVVRDAIRVPALWIFHAAAAVVGLVQTWGAHTFRRVLTAWSWTVFALLTLGQAWFWPWYVSWLIVPVALLGRGRLRTATLVLCVSSLMMYPVEKVVGAHSTEPLIWSGALVMGPPLLYVVASWWLDRRRKKIVSVRLRSQARREQQVVVTSN